MSHILMAQEYIEKEYDKGKIEWMEATTAAMSSDQALEKNLAQSLKDILEERDKTANRQDDNKESDQTEVRSEDEYRTKQVNTGIVAKFAKKLRKLSKAANWDEQRERTTCPSCGNCPEDPVVTSCLHVHCEDCLSGLGHDAGVGDKDSARCGRCKQVFSGSESCAGLKEFEKTRDMSATPFQENSKVKAPVKKKYKLSMDHVDKDNKLVLSTKLLAVKQQIEKWLEEDPKGKIIVFSDWLMT